MMRTNRTNFRRFFAGARRLPPTRPAVFLLLFSLFLALLLFSGFIDSSFILSFTGPAPICTLKSAAKTCRGSYGEATWSARNRTASKSDTMTCPSYFRWIHEDLRHWRESGITKSAVERARRWAHFRVVIVDGRAYVKKYRQSIQTRDVFSVWGILQLLRYYPGKLPDMEIMFDCGDRPVVGERGLRGSKARPPPVFRYCSNQSSLDIVFPDWSFWGWAECNIKPWGNVLADIKEGNKRTKWKNREPYAYWRGNPYVAPTRRDLLSCNVSDRNDWKTRLYIQNWDNEMKQGFKQSNLEDQCTSRYKIYTEGWAWSVSEKYILACNSVTLFIKSQYHDFFVRAMEPLKHYWPIRTDAKCSSLKFAVDWGNNHTDQAEGIGEEASKFMQEDVKMENVYDYMFHLLNEYGKLFKYKPTVPYGAVELCPEAMACPAKGQWRRFMEDSMVKFPSLAPPCDLPPHDPLHLAHLLQRKAASAERVKAWENRYWRSQNTNS